MPMLAIRNHHVITQDVGPIPLDTEPDTIATVIAQEVKLRVSLLAIDRHLPNEYIRVLSVATIWTIVLRGRFMILTICCAELGEEE